MTVLFAANGFGVGSFVGRIPPLKEALELSEGGLGAVLFGPPLGTMTALIAVGAVIGRMGEGRAIVGGLAVGAAGLLLLPLAGGPVAAFLALAVLGAGLGAMDLGMNARGVVVEDRYERSVLVAFHGAWSVGTLLGGAAAGLSIAAGWSTGLHLAVAASLVAVAGTLGNLASRTVEGTRDPSAAARIALPDRVLFPIALIALVSALGEGAVGDWAGVHLRETIGTSTAVAASGFVVFSLTMAVTRLLGDRAVRRFGPRRVARTSGAIATLGYLIAVLSPTVAPALVGFGLVGVGLGTLVPLAIAAAGRRAGGRGIAAVTTVGYTGLLIGPPLIGLLAEATTLPFALGCVGIAAASTAVAGRSLATTDRPTETATG